MPVSKDDQKRIDQLQEAATVLRSHQREDLAGAVDFVQTPQGARMIQRLSWSAQADDKPNYPLTLDEGLRDEIKARAKAAGATLTAEAEAGLQAYIDGKFLPERPAKAKPGTAKPKKNLNVRMSEELRRAAEDHGEKLLEDGVLDWIPRVSQILIPWFELRVRQQFKKLT